MKKKKLIVLLSIIFSVITLTGCSVAKDLVDTASSVSDSVTSESSSEETSDFNPQDTSDATIESISTYNDYITMYSKIIDEYLVNYQNAISGTVLDDGTTLENMRQEMAESLKQQKEEYGAMGNQKIIGKEGIVEFLKSYRDQLKSVTDNLSTSMP